MEFLPITSKQHVHFRNTWSLYEKSFPVAEQRKSEDHLRASQDQHFHPMSAFEDDEFIGFIFYWEWDNYRYVEHMAVKPALRGEGYGSQILKWVCDREHTIILEIDPLINELSVRRLQFYERSGFTLTPFRFIHLPYRLETEAQELLILSYPKMITCNQQLDFLTFLNEKVKQYCEQKGVKGY